MNKNINPIVDSELEQLGERGSANDFFGGIKGLLEQQVEEEKVKKAFGYEQQAAILEAETLKGIVDNAIARYNKWCKDNNINRYHYVGIAYGENPKTKLKTALFQYIEQDSNNSDKKRILVEYTEIMNKGGGLILEVVDYAKADSALYKRFLFESIVSITALASQGLDLKDGKQKSDT